MAPEAASITSNAQLVLIAGKALEFFDFDMESSPSTVWSMILIIRGHINSEAEYVLPRWKTSEFGLARLFANGGKSWECPRKSLLICVVLTVPTLAVLSEANEMYRF